MKSLVTWVFLALAITVEARAAAISLVDVIHHYEKKTGITFLFDSDLVDGVMVEIDTAQHDLEAITMALQEQTAFDFRMENKNILIMPRKEGANLRICGIVMDPEENAPVPGAFIYDHARTFATSTDVNGTFDVLARLSAENKVTIRMMGYEIKEYPIEFFNTGSCATIAIVPDVKNLKDVVINAYMSSGIDYSFVDNSIIVQPNGRGLLPGETDSDVLSSVEALPGIKSPDSKAGNLIIRGASPDQSLITFDNIPIYHKGHYFGTFSPFNPLIVDNVKIFRSAYAADKGGRVGGVVEINSKNRVVDSARFSLGVSTTHASAYSEVPLGNNASILLAGRISYPSGWISPKLNAINDFIYQQSGVQASETNPNLMLNNRTFHFYDLNGKVVLQPGKKDLLTLSFLGIDNRINIEIQNNTTNEVSYNYMHLKNLGYNAEWSKQWNSRVTSRFDVTQSLYNQSYTTQNIVLPDTIQDDDYFENELNDISIKTSTNISLSENSGLDIGYTWQSTGQKYADLSIDSALRQSTATDLHSLYLNYTLSQKSRYILTGGLRNNYYALTQDFRIEPRLMFNYFPSDHWALKSSAGQFHQYITQISGVAIESIGGIENLVWQVANETTVPIVESVQLMAGTMYHSEHWLLDVEFYRNGINDIAINDIVNFSNAYLYGSGWTYGVDVLLKKQWKNLNGWVSYSLSQSNLQFDSIQSDAFDFIYNQRHVFDFVLEYRIKQFKISAGWKYRTGLPALNNIRAKYLHGPPPESDLGPSQPPPQGGPPPPGGQQPGGMTPVTSGTQYQDTFPDFHQLDMSLVYAFPGNRRGWNGTVGLSLINVYNRKNIIEQIPRRTPQGLNVSYKYSLGFAPNLTVSINW